MHNVPNYHHLQVHHCYPMVVMVSRLVVVVIVTVVTIVVVVVAAVAAAGIEFAAAPAVAMDDDEW